MSIDKCTPGKWVANEEYLGWAIRANLNPVCIGLDGGKDNGESDAKLIASSRDMYEALLKILNMSDPGSYEKAIFDMKDIARKALPKL